MKLLLGPLSFEDWRPRLLGVAAVVVALLVTQLGAIAVWLALGVRHPTRPIAAALGTGLVLYSVVWVGLMPLGAQASGRVALPCTSWSGPLRPHSLFYCAAGRNYVHPALASAVTEASADLHHTDPSFVVRYLDGGFPVGLGFPLLPHLSHGDGRRLDLMLQYALPDGTPTSGNGSPIGYWGYSAPTGAAACPPRWLDLRWDFTPLQPLLARHPLHNERSQRLMRRLLADQRIQKVLLEPHLKRRLGLGEDRVRFQGCSAARHDDHVHVQL